MGTSDLRPDEGRSQSRHHRGPEIEGCSSIVDLQAGFVAEGAPVEVPATHEIFGGVNSISRAVREAGGLNVFLRFILS